MRASGSVKIGSYRLHLPRSRILRVAIGLILIIGGFLGFLPVLGFWMVPAGLLVLSVDIPRVRRWRRRFAVWFARRYPETATLLRLRTDNNHNGNHENHKHTKDAAGKATP